MSRTGPLAQAPTRSGDPLGWMGAGPVWPSLLVGAFFGALACGGYQLYASVAPAAVAESLALITAIAIARSAPPSKATTS